MQLTDEELDSVPAKKEHKGFIITLVVNFLIDLGEDLLEKLLDHVKEKRAEKERKPEIESIQP